jgi:Ran GTPase-activating protein (RanGAP) involved in mRNA processing and transport
MQQELQAGGEEDTTELFAQLLNEGSALVFLSLRANGVTSRGAVALARAVRHNKTLEALNLFQNSIGDAGARAFAHALPFNTSLKTLSLANNQLSGRGYVAELKLICSISEVLDFHPERSFWSMD